MSKQQPPERIWIPIEDGCLDAIWVNVELRDSVQYARVHEVDDARVEEAALRSTAAARVAHIARQFCEEVQEDAEGVPQLQLTSLNEALDAWEAYPGTRDLYDDSRPLLAALASLIEDEHATDHQRRVAHLALAAIGKRTNVLDEAERNGLRRAIAESDITDGLLENADIDALVNLFEAWLERRPSLLPQLSSSERTPDDVSNDSQWAASGWCANCGNHIYKIRGKWFHVSTASMDCGVPAKATPRVTTTSVSSSEPVSLKDGGAENGVVAAFRERMEKELSYDHWGYMERVGLERALRWFNQCATATAPTESSERRCGECGHNNTNRNNGFCIEWIDRKQRRCGCKCVFQQD